MAISPKLLGEGEEVVLDTRTHVKVLFVPALLLILFAALTGFLLSLPNGSDTLDTAARWAILAVALAVTMVFVLIPFMRWMAATYTLTNRRLITRAGIVTRRGRDIPLGRISDVSYEKGLLDRILGCGTLIVSDATEQAGVVLKDIPDVELFHLTLNEILFPTAPGPRPEPQPGQERGDQRGGRLGESDAEQTRRFYDGT